MRLAKVLCAAALAATCAAQQNTLSIGLMLPLSHPTQCSSAWQAWHVAQTAVRVISGETWWNQFNTTLSLEALPSDSTFDAWKSADKFASGAQPVCNATAAGGTCRLLRAAMVGPPTSGATAVVQLVTRESGVPLLGYAATAVPLTQPTNVMFDYGMAIPFFRLSYTDAETAGGVWALLKTVGFTTFSILHVRSEHGEGSATALQSRVQAGGVSSVTGAAISLKQVRSFQSGDVDSIDAALLSLNKGEARVLVMFAHSDDAAVVLQRAYALGMAGNKGWVWIGTEWVRELTWLGAWPTRAAPPQESAASRTLQTTEIEPLRQKARDTVQKAMQGVVGVVPRAVPPDFAVGGLLDRFRFSDIGDAAAHTTTGAGAFPPPVPSPDTCPLIFEPPVTTDGLQLDLFAPYVFDAVWSVASAAADAMIMSGSAFDPFSKLTTGHIATRLRDGVFRPSALTGNQVLWLENGDRYGMPMSLVNVVGDKLVTVGTWASDVMPASYAAANGVIEGDKMAGDGVWTKLKPIIWPSGTSVIPTDRARKTDTTATTALVVGLFGLVVSLTLGAVIHQLQLEFLPESGATVLVGAAFGVAIRLLFDSSIRATASFSPDVFMLVLLPIIIFESGYSIDKKPFFTQVGSITVFAVVGTVINAVIIGGIVYEAGKEGGIFPLSFEESMAFGSLLSATDPVAVLATFSVLNVEPSLNALVFGEAVINDAVALVLFRTFTGFLTEDVTVERGGWAIGQFFLVMVASVLIGLLVALANTLLFRLVNISGQSRGSKEDGVAKLSRRLKALKSVMRRAVRLHDDDDAHDGAGGHSAGSDIMAGISETALVLLFAYGSFMLAEALHMSGVVAALVCGIALNVYARPIMSGSGRRVSSAVFKMLASLSDTLVFFQMGMTVILQLGVGVFEFNLILLTVVGCLLGRAANIFPLAFCLNCRRKKAIPMNHQTMQWWSGLRGAIAFAAALSFPTQHKETILNATSWICLATIFAMGGSTQYTLKKLSIPFGDAVTTTRAQISAAADDEASAPGLKRTMVKIDKFIRWAVYGKDLLAYVQEQEAAIARAEAGDAVEAAVLPAAAAAAATAAASSADSAHSHNSSASASSSTGGIKAIPPPLPAHGASAHPHPHTHTPAKAPAPAAAAATPATTTSTGTAASAATGTGTGLASPAQAGAGAGAGAAAGRPAALRTPGPATPGAAATGALSPGGGVAGTPTSPRDPHRDPRTWWKFSELPPEAK